MVISIISAIANNRVIGNKNKLPWYLPVDFKWFKEKTLNKIIILGLNTFKSINEKPLPNRKHIILHHDPNYEVPKDCFLATSIDESLSIAKKLSAEIGIDEIMICGGASVYGQFLPMANRMYLTRIHHDFDGDTFFPDFNKSEWQEKTRKDCPPDERNHYSCSFVVLEKNNATDIFKSGHLSIDSTL